MRCGLSSLYSRVRPNRRAKHEPHAGQGYFPTITYSCLQLCRERAGREGISGNHAATTIDQRSGRTRVDVNEGNKLHRVVVGFGSGASTVDTQVQVYQGTERRKLLEFATHSNSGNLPGAAPMLGAGAAVQGGVTAGMVIGNAALTGVKAYRSEVERMAGDSGDQVARYLSEFFAQHGWIRQDQVKKARIAY